MAKPFVAVIAGSENDLEIIRESEMIPKLKANGLRVEISVISAHRNPAELTEYCRTALGRNARVFIGIAGMAAALPGNIASLIKGRRPVIGVPLIASDGFTSGLDAVLSMMRMPPGLPIAVVGVGKTGLQNAAILACQMMALMDETVDARLQDSFSGALKPAAINLDQKYFTKK